jgi:H+/Cl- antiporter ClcA
MTLSIGLKGGEVTPLFFMGATLSNWACGLFNFKNFGLSSSLGMVALFGAVTATPISSAIMGGELFGAEIGGLCLLSSLIAKFLFGKRSLYRH